MTFSIRLALIVITLSAVVFTAARTFLTPTRCVYDDMVRYAFAERFAGNPKFEEAITRLGPPAEEKGHEWVANQISSGVFRCPDGLEDGDRFVWSNQFGRPCLLQFRNQRFINIDTVWLLRDDAIAHAGADANHTKH